VLSRRTLLAGAASFAASPAVAALSAPQIVEAPVSAARKTQLMIWTPALAPVGVAMFSTGHGSWPDRYAGLIGMLRDEGLAVVAPLHVDSMRHPERDKYSLPASFLERLADLKAAGGYAAERWPGLPILASGHSYGTLNSLCLAGALPYMKARNPAVKAVLGFSSPGKIPGLVPPTAYAEVATPLMIVTGDKDVVPRFVENAADHLFPVETAPPGDKYGLVLAGADHGLIGGSPPDLYRRGLEAGRSFVRAYAKGDAPERRALAARRDSPPERWIIR
jgi:hypothetical protein